ncbi:hypothetical protein Cenrod_0037 [Candidatus Symbiobacter mobilis CR]|uniref:Uncharacterized protein n=1 Tax=Candidatus Symbiobacter mobilis CR TaxID=946483 RepID=U5N4C0_9BURK|nr:hypothetical protein Cenrod_0037 [Candidatus Symbiobacter mobilis CR]
MGASVLARSWATMPAVIAAIDIFPIFFRLKTMYFLRQPLRSMTRLWEELRKANNKAEESASN